MIRPILAYNEDKELTFDNARECAEYFHVCSDTMIKHLHTDMEIDGYFLVLLPPIIRTCADNGDCDNCRYTDCFASAKEIAHFDSIEFGRSGRPYVNEKSFRPIDDDYSMEIKTDAEENIYNG